ncbi:DUF1266 domain-containing protein [Cohnella mopanensis]|uniref:DUF1266 domain-containing protein n=1 Tax=Cohnella mopanensis TaxID=2911966 RepID=UPI001EF983F6|nr:DUF1266 domain-containing protein [Cohnella mopanensis]
MNISTAEAQETAQLYIDALSAMCIVGKHGDYHVQNPNWIFTKRNYLRNLCQHWEVGNSDELKDNIKWSLSVGHRKEFEDMNLALSTQPESDRSHYIEMEKDNPTRRYKLSIVNDYLERMPPGGIAATDYTWAVFKCCAGFKLDYLTEEEKWKYINEIIAIIRSNYTNWKDFLISFTVGSAYTSLNRSADYISENKALLAKLLVSPYSPLRKVKLNG